MTVEPNKETSAASDAEGKSARSQETTSAGHDGAIPTATPPGAAIRGMARQGVVSPEEPALATAVALAPDVLATSLSEYLGAWWKRIRGGQSGALPIILGLIAIVVFFQIENAHFLTAGNIVNLMNQAVFFILLGLAEVFALLLAEIDLSIGYVAAVGAAVTAALVSNTYGWPWWAAVIVGMLVCTMIGILQGVLITRLHLPSFVVTLAGLLGWAGFLIFIFDVDKGSVGGVINVNNKVLYNLVNGNMTPVASWVVFAVLIALFAFLSLSKAARRRSQGLSAPPLSITIATIILAAVAGAVLVTICNLNRGVLGVSLRGVPWDVLYVLAIVAGCSWLFGRTRYGRYLYAIGASPEAARRAGINVTMIRTIAFGFSGLIAGLAGLAFMSRLGSISVSMDGGTYVLYAVAAAVIGGTSLLGGRGKAIDPVLGGLVIAAVANGLDLLNISTAGTEMATAVVLIAAVTVDSMARRRTATSGT